MRPWPKLIAKTMASGANMTTYFRMPPPVNSCAAGELAPPIANSIATMPVRSTPEPM